MSDSQDNIDKRRFSRRHYSPSASINESTPRGFFTAMCVCGILGLVFGFGGMIIALISEREARIMQDDLKFIRAYLNARGIKIPANHEEAEE